MLGGFLAGAILGTNYLTGLNLETILVAFLGAVLLLAILRSVPLRSTRRRR